MKLSKLCLIILLHTMVANLLMGCDQDTSNSPPAASAAGPVEPAPPPEYVGAKACSSCHQQALQEWQQSHHDLAMQTAEDDTVLGDFANAQFNYHGITSTFSRQGDRFIVRTDGPDGALQEYEIAYTFGVFPLQQYLIELEDGRMQALGIAWDSRPSDAGGQRWFHLYPEQQVEAGHRLHWTAADQNWNHMCAECHSTQLRKQYDPDTDSFATTFSEMNVACEACHGPGSKHVDWANSTPRNSELKDYGLTVSFDERDNVTWLTNNKTGLPNRSKPLTSAKEINTCARCHSRRGVLSEDFHPGEPIGNTHRIALLSQDLYHADGQPDDENYVYGSFLQSKMHQAGVTCSDCHNPHSLTLKLPGDQVCSQCHASDHYAQTEHHMHPTDSEGASCIACHMPVKRFMGVDDRHDHSFRIPRPDLSVQLDTPNTCTQCHQNQTAEWAATQIQQHYPHPATGLQTYAETLHRGRQGDPSVAEELNQLARNTTQPAIARASAVELLSGYPSQPSLRTLLLMTDDPDPLVRRASAHALAQAPAELRVQALVPLLHDDVRVVRITAARSLASINPDQYLQPTQKKYQTRALEEYIASLQLNADRAESWFNLGTLYEDQGKAEAAESAYLKAIKTDSSFIPAAVNLTNLYEAVKSASVAKEFLQQQLQNNPDAAPLYHAQGLAQIREQDYQGAKASLQRAVELAPNDARNQYILAVLEFQLGNEAAGFDLLQDNINRHPFDFNTLQALVSYAQKFNHQDILQRYLTRLQAFAQP